MWISLCTRYYNRLYTETSLSLDGSLVKEYFPVSFVVPAMLDIYQHLLGVKFVEIHGDAKDTWHFGESFAQPHMVYVINVYADVRQFAVWEKDAQDESGFVGYCYLDLYPRGIFELSYHLTASLTFDILEAKFPHAAVFCILPGYELPNGKRHYPVAAMVANLAKPTPERPALMTHFDVTTLFHEMGHIFHELLSRTRYSRFHGTTGALDFVEAPSQMLENWSVVFPSSVVAVNLNCTSFQVLGA